MRIAYVEDNPTNQALVERVARMTEHVIVPYAEGEIALHALQTEPFDLIMMDIELAGKVNGLDVVRGLRTAGLKTPIIAVTAYAMLGDRDRCLEAGCNDYLPKPIPIKDLLDLLGRYDVSLKAPAAAPAETPAASVPVTPPLEPEPVPTPAPVSVPVTPPVVAETVAATPEAQPEAESKPAVTVVAGSDAPPGPAVVAEPTIPVTPPILLDRPAVVAPASVAASAPESVAAPASISTPETPTTVIVAPPLPETNVSAPPTDASASVAEGSEPAATPA